MRIAHDIDEAVNELLLHFVTEKSAAICSALTPIAVSALTIYFILTGMTITRSTGQHTAKDLIWNVLRISFIIEISLSAGTYQFFVVDGLDAIGASLIQTVSGVTTFADLIDNMAEPFAELGQKLWSDATTGIMPHVGLLFAAAIVSVSQTILFSVGLGFYLLAKISVALVLALGPCFLLCAIWPSTAKYAENWLGQTLNYIFLKVLISTTIVMLISFSSQFAEHISGDVDTVNVIRSSCALLISCIALSIVIIFHPYLASALFGGASISGIGRAAMHTFLRMLEKLGPGQPGTNNRISNAGGTVKPQNSVASSPLYQRHALNQLQTSRPRRAA